MDDLDNFKVGDILKITNIKTDNFEIGKLLEFNKKNCLIKLIPQNNKIKIFYHNKYIKIEKYEVL